MRAMQISQEAEDARRSSDPQDEIRRMDRYGRLNLQTQETYPPAPPERKSSYDTPNTAKYDTTSQYGRAGSLPPGGQEASQYGNPPPRSNSADLLRPQTETTPKKSVSFHDRLAAENQGYGAVPTSRSQDPRYGASETQDPRYGAPQTAESQDPRYGAPQTSYNNYYQQQQPGFQGYQQGQSNYPYGGGSMNNTDPPSSAPSSNVLHLTDNMYRNKPPENPYSTSRPVESQYNRNPTPENQYNRNTTPENQYRNQSAEGQYNRNQTPETQYRKQTPESQYTRNQGLENQYNSPQYVAGSTPGVVGAQEVYRDPRDRLNALKGQSDAKHPSPERISFRDKMKMFATEIGENTPKERTTISKAQREIEGQMTNGR